MLRRFSVDAPHLSIDKTQTIPLLLLILSSSRFRRYEAVIVSVRIIAITTSARQRCRIAPLAPSYISYCSQFIRVHHPRPYERGKTGDSHQQHITNESLTGPEGMDVQDPSQLSSTTPELCRYAPSEELASMMGVGWRQRQRLVYVAVPFEDKDQAKRLGARWNKLERLWCVHQLCPCMFPQQISWYGA